MSIDISATPFSRFGSYVALTHDRGANRLVVHNAARPFAGNEALSICFEPAISVSATESLVTVTSDEGSLSVAIADDESMLIEAEGPDCVLELSDRDGYGHELGDNRFEMISAGRRQYHLFTVLEGRAELRGVGEPETDRPRREYRTVLAVSGASRSRLLVRITQTQDWTPPPLLSTESISTVVREEWLAFRKRMPAVPGYRTEVAEYTWFNIWSSFVRARGCYGHDVMLMSKKYMSSVWSWDHCFNALVLADTMPDRAYEQFIAPFDLQAPSGVLPDMWNPNNELVWGITKPPIHGWCFSALMDRIRFDQQRLQKVYDHLERWTRWWLEYRDNDGDGIPCYPQGCDSGWDNSTSFDLWYFVETPDLPAYLVLQMKCLARIAGELNRSADAETWRAAAADLTGRFMEHSWTGDRFVSKQSNTHRELPDESSLLALMPIVMGEHLDAAVMDRLAELLQADFLTEHGLATERPSSPLYEADGYWRGPIWAPVTYLIVDGLRRAGRSELARTIARRFCDMIQYTAGGNYENFDALTGHGLCAPGYTWTASVNMLLMSEYADA